MKRTMAVVVFLVFAVSFGAGAVVAPGSKYSAMSEYMMEPNAEIALAKSAAPDNVSATIKVLTTAGYKMAVEGNNGFVCVVLRGWGAPTFTPAGNRQLIYETKVRAPICFDPVASRTVLAYQELRTKLGMEGEDPVAIANRVSTAYSTGELPKMEGVSFAYMWSADSNLGPGVGAWHPHMMVYSPYYTNAMLGNNECGGAAPCVGDDAGTPFAVVVIPVHGITAIKAKSATSQK